MDWALQRENLMSLREQNQLVLDTVQAALEQGKTQNVPESVMAEFRLTVKTCETTRAELDASIAEAERRLK